MLADGSIVVLGRCDDAVKVRGYTVVLGAVEAAVRKLVAVNNCAVLVQGTEGSQVGHLGPHSISVWNQEIITRGLCRLVILPGMMLSISTSTELAALTPTTDDFVGFKISHVVPRKRQKACRAVWLVERRYVSSRFPALEP